MIWTAIPQLPGRLPETLAGPAPAFWAGAGTYPIPSAFSPTVAVPQPAGKMQALANQVTSNWQFAHLANLGGLAWLGGGSPVFLFRAPHLQGPIPVAFVGPGVGPGGTLSGVELGAALQSLQERAERLAWKRLEVLREFSLAELHNSSGTLSQLTACFTPGFGVLSATASNLRGPLFDSTALGGGVGVGLVATSVVGSWCVLSNAISCRNPAGQQLAPRTNLFLSTHPNRRI